MERSEIWIWSVRLVHVEPNKWVHSQIWVWSTNLDFAEPNKCMHSHLWVWSAKLDHTKPNECVQIQIIRRVVGIGNTESGIAVVCINDSYACKMAGFLGKSNTSISCIPSGIKFGVVAVGVRQMKAFSENSEGGESDTLVKARRWKATYCVWLTYDINKISFQETCFYLVKGDADKYIFPLQLRCIGICRRLGFVAFGWIHCYN